MLMMNPLLSPKLIAGFIGLLLVLLTAGANAGSLDAPAAPSAAGSAMFTITDLYNRLNTGATGAKRAGAFVEPASAPASTVYTLDQIMGLMPTVDDTGGATAGDVLSGKTFWSLRSGAWGPRTGTLIVGAAPVQKTGQTLCYDPADLVAPVNTIACGGTGQDGALLKGVALPTPRFTNNGNGTVTDNLTGLIWLTNANCSNSSVDWATALTYVTSLNTTGTMNGNNCGDTSNAGSYQTDWRLPNRRELFSLIHDAYINPALSNSAGTGQWTAGDPFTNFFPTYYWSSTTSTNFTSDAWIVAFNNGIVNAIPKSGSTYRVWPVRGGL